MPLNKLENFIKNAEGRILYVNPNDLDSTDGIENQGNSLTKPFKTIQRALLESARFSYLRGDDNDLVEKTTILVFPGEHLIDNRPGYAIKDNGGVATAVAPGGSQTAAQNELTLTLNSNFDLTQENNILYKFNSIYGGIIIPRGTSIVGLDLRKTKVRPKYVPNPTDPNAPSTSIFRVTGACYFWQFTFFDGDETGLVYTDPRDFSTNNRSKPTFSHHKVTCFEYADGVNIPGGYQLTDLDMYYSKISNAFNRASGREIDQKFPVDALGFSKQRPEWEIVGAFATDPVVISNIISGDGATPGTIVTVTTQTPHNLNSGTPIKIRNINVNDYNISTKVVDVLSDTRFTYALPYVKPNLPAGPGAGLAPGRGASVVIETDTVSGASPYIFNVSLRSVYGMQGMHADGSKADGFRSMVVAQFTAVSLQKDDRAFVKYDQSSRRYDGLPTGKTTGDQLSSGSSSTNESQVYHLDSNAVYRDGWKSTHIKMSNDAVIQVVSVFAIGFHKHFECLSGGDASITNSNSNFGQFSLAADGFKRAAFGKDDKGFVTGVVTPRSIGTPEIDIEWVQFDVGKTKSVGKPNRIYLLGYTQEDVPPPIISQGYRIGAKVNDKVYLQATVGGATVERDAKILMTNDIPESSSSNTVSGVDTSSKIYSGVTITVPGTDVTGTKTVYNTLTGHNLRNGESIRIFSETGDLPEGLEENRVYYAITSFKNSTRTDGVTLSGSQFQVAASKTNADAATPIFITSYGGDQLRVESRVSDKVAGEIGHPIQYDYVEGNWFVYVDSTSTLYQYFQTLIPTITSTQITLAPSDGQTYTVGSTSYPVMGKLYVPTSLATNSIDVVVVFHGTLSDTGTQTIAQAAENSLNVFLDQNNLNVRDKIIFSAAYPQDNISQSRQYGLTGVGTEQADFLMGDNLPYAQAAVRWVQNSLNAFMTANGISKTIGNVYLFGHSQGGKLVTKMNTTETGIAGVVANAPGPIQFDQTCAGGGSSSISCTKIAAIHGASAGDGSAPYEAIGLETYTSTHNAPLLFTQALDDDSGGVINNPVPGSGRQINWLRDYVNAIDAIGANADTTLTEVATGGHAAFTTNATLQAAIRTFLGSNADAEIPESEISYIKRVEDGRSIDEKVYKLRYVVPKELENARDPVSGFVLQESSTVNVREVSDFNLTTIGTNDYGFNRNPKFISTCTYNNPTNTIVYSTDKPHNLRDNDIVIIEGVTSTTNESALENFGYNGSFRVVDVKDSNTFTVNDVDIFNITHTPGLSNFNTSVRDKTLPTLKRNDAQDNLYIYRVETITPYVKDVQDGVYYLYVLNANNSIQDSAGNFSDGKYSQNITNLYPQLDRDNKDDNPPSAASYAKRTPLGEVVTNDLRRSLTRETTDKFFKAFTAGNEIVSATSSNTSASITLASDHGLAGITTFSTLTGGSGHTDGTYYNVRLINNQLVPPTNLETINLVWDGALATVEVSGGSVTNVVITANGSGYTDGETLYFDSNQIGGTPQAGIGITTADINIATNDYVQVTGIGTTGGGYYRITTSSVRNQIAIAKTAGDPVPVPGEYITVLGRVGNISNHTVTGNLHTFTVTADEASGLIAGNSVRLLDSSDNNLGDYYINSVVKGSTNTFNINTSVDISTASRFMKHGVSANNASADSFGENIGTRTLTFYDNNILLTKQTIGVSDSQFKVAKPDGHITKIESRFPVGSYIQIDNEIMRVKSSRLTGTNSDEIQVIRGSMGTIIETHEINSQVKKIKVLPIEARRPSILRASGHTFEYLGYGPGNYSTGLPQVQIKTLSEDEEFLSQSQETSCGTVLYTGMDSDGDFYIGNTKYSAQSGEQKTFDVPIPTVTGEDPNRLSVVFDEIVVKERILVEGGKSKQILSQFDGPVTFTGNVRYAQTLILNGIPSSIRTAGSVDIKSQTDALNCTDQNAALRVAGGVAIGKRLFVCSDTDIDGGLDVAGITTISGTSSALLVRGIVPNTLGNVSSGALQVAGGAGIGGNLSIGGAANFGGALTIGGDLNMGTNNMTAGGGRFGNIRIAITNDNTIDTASGNLILDSTGGLTSINDNLSVGGNFAATGTGNFGGSVAITGALTVTGDITAFFSSDERLKDNIARIEDPLAKVLSISGNTYDWNEKSGKEGHDVGVIAQEVLEVLPEAVTERDNGYLAVDYQRIVPLLVEAIKELSDKVSALEDKLNN